jgi:hypothetical protein
MPCANKDCSSLVPTRAPVPVWMDWPRSKWSSILLRRYRQMRERWRQAHALRQLWMTIRRNVLSLWIAARAATR